MGKFKNLRNQEGAVRTGETDPLLHCIQSPSPSLNWSFAVKGHGLPFGYAAILWGPPKSGKSIVCNAWTGQLHKDDPEALVISFNTELRGEIQANADQLKMWGIDENRFQVFDRNQPEGIFDFIEKDVDEMCQAGEKIKLIVIDSLKGIQGRRFMNSTTVMQQQVGDEAATLQDGLKRILPVIRKHKIALIMTNHVRAELDPKEQMRGKTVKMAGAWAGKHMAEFFIYVEPNRSKDGRTNLAGEEFLDPATKDFMDKSEKTGHKIRIRVDESSLGISGRTGEFTMDYDKGIINVHEEIFTLGKNLGIITKPNLQTYEFKGKTWRGLPGILTAIRDDEVLAKEILTEIYAKDI